MGTDADRRTEGEPTDGAERALPRRAAVVITAGVLFGFCVIDGSYVWFEYPPLWEWAAVVLGFAALLGLQLAHSFPGLAPWPARYRRATWVLQGLLAYLPVLRYGVAWGGMSAFFTASAVLVFPATTGWCLFGLGYLGEFLVFYHFRTGWDSVAYAAVESALIPLTVIALSRMSDMVVKLHRSREELARLAVAAERLRFARDLHDVLGFSLSAISLRCELAYRLLADNAAKARAEVGEVLVTSRKALADVRAVSVGYREMSLSGEAHAAVSLLGGAGIRTTLEFDAMELPHAVDAALATVLREGLTNLLRHSKAERCELRAEHRSGAVVLVLSNDGAGRGRAAVAGTDGTLAALAERLTALGGTLTHGPDGPGRFGLRAVVPVPVPDSAGRRDDTGPARAAVGDDAERSAARPPGLGHRDGDDAEQPAVQPHGLGHRDLPPRAASAFNTVVLVGYFLAYSILSISFDPSPGRVAVVEACLSAMTLVQLAVSFPQRVARMDRLPRPARQAVLGAALVLLQFAPLLVVGPTYLGMPGFLAGTALLALPARAAWPVCAAVLASAEITLCFVDPVIKDYIYFGAYTPICAVVVFGLSRMAQLASELHRSRAEIARLAVTTERLRFARDLHDLLGFSLSAITLKCELVRRLAPSRPVQAQAELTEVLQIARQALADVRTVAEGRQRMSLTEEAENATAMLAGVGIRATVATDCGDLPDDIDTVLATTLREGLTNMLRHSRATHCEIRAERTPAGVRLTLVNDGLHACAVPGLDSKADGGSGLGNLTTRVEAVNGRLFAGARPDGWFELKAEVELAMV
ncbi:sensor histidine kinase [Streptomyces sp. NBC_00083]|uniref:sensor histidine kinase n=1 Tax=Streptomyces sp. NBC_00083 TaxID=2975647 RepID=UPI0022502639|nr:histidine kinase [Streptomyces sp. NBC_00083]MCX5382538.1 histidine kinase [Streptomyces sp. NBC_00083]